MSMLGDKVYQELLRIQLGQVISYKELARRIGSPHAVRAVATLVGKNPNPINVPCHRIIKSNRELGNYTWRGKSNPIRKRELLKQEGVLFDMVHRSKKGKGTVVYVLNTAPKGAIL